MQRNEGFSKLLNALNPAQRKPVLEGDGPVLVLAGAGSGKTRVLTNRIAYVLHKGKATPESILAVTFTNKAAQEMRERLERIIGFNLSHCWIGTFHSLGARILRREASNTGLQSSFNIYDEEDRLNCIKLILKEKNIAIEKIQPKLVVYTIRNSKNAFLTASDYKNFHPENEIERQIADIYVRYQEMLHEYNAVDFDDLLMLPVLLFQDHPEILTFYQNKFTHLLVDEYQDTNRTQYLLLQLLAGKHKNLFVVGDDDQSIYRWRGADLRNILEFEKDYPDCKIFRMEQNYRSSKNILAAAHSVIVNNMGRHSKELWTDKPNGDKVQILQATSDRGEAEFVVDKIQSEFLHGKRQSRDFAILYRTNAQSRTLEDALRRNSIAYVIVGGTRFYERKEVKDMLAYFRVVANPLDSISMNRIINYPLRGIGEATLAKLRQYALENKLSFFKALADAENVPGLGERVTATIKDFHRFIQTYISLKEQLSLTELVNALVEETGILQKYKEEGTPDALSRMENIRELLNAVYEYAQAHDSATLEGFLEEVSLIADIDSWEDRSNAVTLMTLHSAKGLEFPVVFISGLEEGLFPLSRSHDNRDDLEEERRLFYVGATRAKEKLYITWASSRRKFGSFSQCYPSRFLRELDKSLIDLQVQNKFNDHYAVYSSGRTRRRSSSDEFEQTMPDYENFSQEEQELHIGTRILHPKFGIGTVATMNGRGENLKINVDFENEGLKTLMVKYAKIQILG
jgi:DNA helicase-2/ATP-dependent DNA helicase PcrA